MGGYLLTITDDLDEDEAMQRQETQSGLLKEGQLTWPEVHFFVTPW
jgi:hypothetical protein